jgi:gas vesicle protein
MFYWGLLIGLIIGANIGVVVAGLFSRSKKEERAALWTEDTCGWVDTRPIKTKESSPKKTEKPYPSE